MGTLTMNSIKNKLWFVAILAILICSLCTSCRDRSVHVTDPNEAKLKLAEFGKKMYIDFPPSTRLISYRWLHGLDESIYLEVQISVEELKDFLLKSPFADVKFRTNEKNRRPLLRPLPERGWEREPVPENWRSVQVRLPNAEYINILIDMDDPSIITIYLHWGTT